METNSLQNTNKAKNIRSEEFFQQNQRAVYRQTDQIFAILLPIQWLAGIAAAYFFSPLTWNGEQSSIHPHLWIAIFVGGAITSLPLYLTVLHPGETITRYVVAVSQILMSGVLIHISDGRSETHFHIFGSLAFLACYRDWRILVPATVVTIADHFFRGWLYPFSLYGIVSSGEWRWLEHAGWVLFTDVFLTVSCLRSVREMRENAIKTSAVNASEERYRTVIEQMTESIFLLDPESFNVIECNQAFVNLIGCQSVEEAKTLHASDFDSLKPEEIHQMTSILRDEMKSMSAERKYRRRDGSWIYVEITGKFISYNDTNAFCVNARDITERKQTQIELRRLALVAEKTQNAVIVTGTEGQIKWVNNGFTRLTGYQLNEVLGKKPGRFLQGEKTDLETALAIREAVAQGKPFEGEIYNYGKNGKGYWLSLSIMPITGKKGELKGFIAIEMDITERKAMESELRRAYEDLELRISERTAELTKANELMLIEAAERKGAEKALQDSRDYLNRVINTIADPIFVVDKNHCVVLANSAFCQLMGRSYEDTIGQNPETLFPPEKACLVIEANSQVFTSGKEASNEEHITDESGKPFIILTKKTIYQAPNGEQFIVGVIHDITENKRVEEVLQASEAIQRKLAERQSAILDALPAHICLLDHSGIILEVNNEWKQFRLANGYDGDNFGIGSNYIETCENSTEFCGEGSKQAAQICRAVLSGDSSNLEMEYPYYSSNEKRWFKLMVNAIDEENFSGAVVMHVDITERKRAEHNLNEAKQFLNTVIDNIPNLIFVKDIEGRYILANRALAKLYKTKSDAMIGKTDADFSDDPEVIERHYIAEQAVIETMEEIIIPEEKITGHDGNIYWFHTVKRPLIGDEGVENILGIATDLTDRKIMESQLRHSQKMESIGQLAAGIAHEINTPTQYVGDNTRFIRDAFTDFNVLFKKFCVLLNSVETGEVKPELISNIKAEIKSADFEYLIEELPNALQQSLDGVARIAKIVQSMKDFAHPGSREKQSADINRAIESTVTVARNEWKYVADVETSFDNSLPLVPCFLGEFNQVVLNMVINAAHAISDVVGDGSESKGKITITTKKVNDEWAEVRIGDTGNGIPADIRRKVFDPFFTTKPVGKGTGQGLAISHTVVVDKHHGQLNFETEPGLGTTFIIRLPLENLQNSEQNGNLNYD